MVSYLKKLFSSSLKQTPVIIFWLLIWEGVNALIGSNIIMVSPRVAFIRLYQIGQTAEFWHSIGTSLGRILLGFTIALAVGVAIAIFSAASKVFHRLILPAINVINAIPIASFIVIALMAFHSESLSIFVAFVTVLPIIFYNTHKGIVTTDPMLLEMAKVFNVPSWKKVAYIYLKTVAPYFLSAANVGIGFAWKSGIAGELIGVVRGTIGANLHTARIFLQTADLFAWTIAIVFLSYIMDRVFRILFGRVMEWQSK